MTKPIHRLCTLFSLFLFSAGLLNAQAPSLQWQKCIGGSGGDYVNSAVEATNGGYVFAGTSGSSDGNISVNLGGGDGMLFKLDLLGNLKWISCFR
ncbi:MAG TPA: hypothetical protein VNZ86_02445 [Bacteroidia bacterium]|jgi:hypothetical protein|nr:hypothetical protein [Bacteroidia bacterium]